MTDVLVWDTMVQVIRETFDDDTITVTRETTANDVVDWDSLSHVELMVALEMAFKVKFSTGELAALKNVGALADLVAARVHDAHP